MSNYDDEPCDRIESICCCSRCRSLRAFDEETEAMSNYINGELIRVEAGREGSPVCHIVWDSYAGREVRIYPK